MIDSEGLARVATAAQMLRLSVCTRLQLLCPMCLSSAVGTFVLNHTFLMMKNPENDVNDRIGKSFRERNEDRIVEVLPQRWVDLIRYLDEREREQLLREAAKAVPPPSR